MFDAPHLTPYNTSITRSLITLSPTDTVVAGESLYVKVRTTSIWTPPTPTDVTTQFVYDGDGGRVKKITSAGATTYLGQSYEVAPDGTKTKYFLAGSQRIAALDTPPTQQASLKPTESKSTFAKLWRDVLHALAFWKSPQAEAATTPTLRFYHTDHLGSSNVITDGSGNVVEIAEYTPYGSLANHTGTVDVDHKFTGQRYDVSTGLYFYNARYYDPTLGRFTQPDTIVQSPSDPQSLNRYSYVRNNPVRFVDPSGHFFWFIPFLIGIAKAAIVGAAINASVAAVTGGNIGKAALIGAVGGAIMGVGAAIAGTVSLSTSFLTSVARVGVMAEFGAFAGMAGAAMSGGSLGRGAAFGALGAGAFSAIGALPLPNNVWGAAAEIGLSAGVGGGISKLAGGEFWQGAAVAGTISSARHLYRATLQLTGQNVADPSLRTSDGSWAPKPKNVVTWGDDAPDRSDTGIAHHGGRRNWFHKYIGGEEALLMRGLSRFVPGVEGLSEAHDPYTDKLGPSMPGFTVPIYDQGTIPLFYGMTVAGALYNPPILGAQLGTYNYDDN